MSQFEYHKAGNSQAQQDEALAYLFAQVSTGKAATGVLSGLAVSQTGTASGSVLVGAGAGVVQAATLDGAGLLVNDSQASLDVLTANPMGSLPRNDIVVFDRATTSVSVIVGTPNATPTDPTVPTSAVALARLRNAASATTIPTSAIDDLRSFTSLFGVTPPTCYAQSAGVVPGFSAGTLAPGVSINSAVTFPAGRFSQPPIVNVTMTTGPGGSAYLVPRALSITATGFSIYVFNAGSANASFSGLTVNWSAIQMTSASASG